MNSRDRFSRLPSGVRRGSRPLLLGFLLLLATSSGCENAGQGAVSGAGIGALSGLAIGSLTGSAGKGAAIGAVVGGVGGAVVGDQNRRRNEEAAAANAPPPPPPPAYPPPPLPPLPPPVVVTQTYRTGSPLGRLVGQWRVSGSIDDGNGNMLPVYGNARAVVDNVYFVRIELHFVDPRSGMPVDGTSVISQTGGQRLEMTNSFSSSPETERFDGEMDTSGTVFNLRQVSPPGSSRQIVIRMFNGPGWTADVWNGKKRLESYAFSPVNP